MENSPQRLSLRRSGKQRDPELRADGNLAGYDDGETSAAYQYDTLRRKTQETVDYGDVERTFVYTYSPNGLKKTMTMPDGTTYAYGYGSNNELRSISIPGLGEIALSDSGINGDIQHNYNNALTVYNNLRYGYDDNNSS